MSDPGALEDWCKLNGCYEAVFGKPKRRATRDVKKEKFEKMQPIISTVKKVESNKIETDKELDTGTTISNPTKTNVKKDLSEIELEEAITQNDISTNKLAILRKKISHDIDETFGTKLEEKKLPNVLKRVEEPMSKIVEKLVSNKKVKE